MWTTTTARHDYALRLADPDTRQVALFTAIEETDALSPCCIPLAVDGAGRVAEVETVVARNADEGFAFRPQSFAPKPVMEAVVPPGERSSREELLALADGYFETIQRKDGTIRTSFHPDCDRVENGVQTT